MTAFFKKHSTVLLISLLIILLILARLFPSAGLILGIVFLLFSLFIASSAVVEKHKDAYHQGKLTRADFIRNAVVEITGTLLAMILVGLLGRMAAQFATQGISHELARVIVGILTGLLVGIGVGSVAKKTWGQLVKVSPEG
jgi:hypothetical protein